MNIDILYILVVVIVAGLGWYANNALNGVPVLKNVINVLIVVISVLVILQNCGLIGTSGRPARVGTSRIVVSS